MISYNKFKLKFLCTYLVSRLGAYTILFAEHIQHTLYYKAYKHFFNKVLYNFNISLILKRSEGKETGKERF